MSRTLASPTEYTLHVNRTERAETAKAVPVKDKELTWQELGECLIFVRLSCGLGLKEFAAVLGRPYQQIQQQESGRERPQIELLWMHEQFRRHLIIAMAKRCTNGVDVVTTISVKGEV